MERSRDPADRGAAARVERRDQPQFGALHLPPGVRAAGVDDAQRVLGAEGELLASVKLSYFGALMNDVL